MIFRIDLSNIIVRRAHFFRFGIATSTVQSKLVKDIAAYYKVAKFQGRGPFLSSEGRLAIDFSQHVGAHVLSDIENLLDWEF